MHQLDHAEAVCSKVYEDTRDFYRRIEPSLGTGSCCGFRVLYSPVLWQPAVMFIGFQPGHGAQARDAGQEASWPEEMEYVVQKWHLAPRMQEIFDIDFLKTCMAANAVFLRAPNKKAYNRVPLNYRREVSQFCGESLAKILKAVEPRRIIFIGLDSDTLTEKSGESIFSPTGRRLARYGNVAGVPSLAVLHLSGCRISTKDRSILKELMREFSAEKISVAL